jgi:hypothetical protein
MIRARTNPPAGLSASRRAQLCGSLTAQEGGPDGPRGLLCRRQTSWRGVKGRGRRSGDRTKKLIALVSGWHGARSRDAGASVSLLLL